jgi:hypothetical protein
MERNDISNNTGADEMEKYNFYLPIKQEFIEWKNTLKSQELSERIL